MRCISNIRGTNPSWQATAEDYTMKNIIPEHIEGKKLDCFESIEFSNTEEARHFYGIAQLRLLDIRNWAHITEIPSATFCLVDDQSNELTRPAEVDDFIRIDIPGPGLPSSKGYDWVRVEDITKESTDDYQRTVLTLRPTPDPINDNPDTAHFFKAVATSTILVEQRNNSVLAHYAGRNEVVNTENHSFTDNLRNFLVGISAKIGASFPQWKALVAGLVKKAEKTSDY